MKIPRKSIAIIVILFSVCQSWAAEDKAETHTISISPKLDAVIIDQSGEGISVETVKNSNERLKSFNENAKKMGLQGKIESCDMLIKFPGWHGYGNYGAYCKLAQGKRKLDVELCDDDMVGYFVIKHTSVMMQDKASLIKFVADNCFGG